MKANLLLLLLIFSPLALAHKVVSNYYLDGQTLEGEVGFSNGEMALAGTAVEVWAGEQQEGHTQVNEEGIFSWTLNKQLDYRFVVDMGAGHVAELLVPLSEFNPSAVSSTTPTVSTDSKDIQSAISQAIRPLQKEIQALKEKRYWQDILGGVGYILGLFGIAAWVQSRRTPRA